MYPMTTNGISQLQKQLKDLIENERPKVIKDIARAREYGDLSENAEYHAARERQRFIENQIEKIQRKVANAQIIDVSALEGTRIVFGAYITLFDEDKEELLEYQIVGEDEADLSQKKVSIISALSKGLIGKEEGDSIELSTPRGEKHYTIKKVSYRGFNT